MTTMPLAENAAQLKCVCMEDNLSILGSSQRLVEIQQCASRLSEVRDGNI
jgi:hypothetical protein